MKTSEIRELSAPELKERILEEREVLVRMKLNHTVSPLDNPVKIRYQRRLVAKLITEVKRRELNKVD
jgi:large subunit ribosomal protein L29